MLIRFSHVNNKKKTRDLASAKTDNRKNFLIITIYFLNYAEIPRVITALQQQNTAPEVQQYDSDPYQTDNEKGKQM